MRSLLFACCILLSSSLFAQSIQEQYNRYISTLNGLNASKSTAQLEELLWDDYTLESTDVGLLGGRNTRKLNKEDYVDGIENFLNYKEINFKMTSDKVNIIYEDSIKGDMTSEQKLMVYHGDKHIETRTFQTHLYFKKFDGEWKLVRNIQVNTIEERNAGKCPCTIYSNNDQYLTETFIPTGFQYNRMFDKFRFSKDAERTIIQYKDELYYHMPNNDLLNSSKVKIGSAATREEAIHFILGMKYKQTCLSF